MRLFQEVIKFGKKKFTQLTEVVKIVIANSCFELRKDFIWKYLKSNVFNHSNLDLYLFIFYERKEN